MTTPPTPKSTCKVETLVRDQPTIVSRREEDVALRKWSLSRYCSVRYILETKTKVGSTGSKVPTLRTNPKIDGFTELKLEETEKVVNLFKN
jgi:hypothetical protein